ncbi:MAG TPA: hypothetical protein VJI75_06595 [Candidatus Nanoarchaeia archaeon]|nr:hypothetical protein [Candidatus Nanoarchaeia archaeon]
MIKLILLLISTLIFVSGCAKIIPQQNVTENTNMFENISNEELYSCEIDSDCVIVKSACCGCNAMGKSTSINKRYLEDWNSNQRVICADSDCAMAISQHISCFSEPKCLNNTCKLIPRREELCDSLLLLNCKKSTPEDQLDSLQRGNGISCREVIELCA